MVVILPASPLQSEWCVVLMMFILGGSEGHHHTPREGHQGQLAPAQLIAHDWLSGPLVPPLGTVLLTFLDRGVLREKARCCGMPTS